MSADEELVNITRKMLSDFEKFIDCYIVCSVGISILEELKGDIKIH